MTAKRLQQASFIVLFLAALALTYFVFRPYLGMIILAGVLALLAWPIHRRLLGLFGGQRSASAFLTMVIMSVLVLLPLTFFVVSVAQEAIQVLGELRSQIDLDDVAGTLSKVIPPAQARQLADEAGKVFANLADFIRPYFVGLTANLFSIFSNAATFIFDAVVVMFALYYLLKNGDRLKEELIALSPLKDSDDRLIFGRVREAVWAVAFGEFVVASSRALLASIFFLILGIEAPVFWGAMVGLTHFIPIVGTAVVTAPLTIYLFVTGHFWKGLIMAIFAAVVIGLMDNFVAPQVIKGKLRIHPFLIFISIIGGLQMFGFIGLFFGPIVLAVTLALIGIYKKEFKGFLEKAK